MKPVIWLLFVLALTSEAIGAQGGARPFERVQIAGKEYVRLTEWARASDSEVRWLKRDEMLQVSNPSFRLQLTIDSCEARLNGIQVWLLSPIANRNGTVFIAHQDLQTTLRPILAPAKPNSVAAPIRSICLDPGHGGKDPGFCVGPNKEKKYTLLLAQEVRRQLTHTGFKVTLTRNSDSTIELPTRPEVARQRNADLFLSLHFNAAQAAPNSVQGTEVYCLTPAGADSTNGRGPNDGSAQCAGNRFNDKNMFLAYQLQKSLTQTLQVEDRGVRRARFWVLRDATMPAVLIEAGFLSHPAEGRRILDADYRRQIAHAIVEGVLAYKRQLEPAEDVRTARR